MARQQYYPRADPNAQNFYAAYPALFDPSRRMGDVNVLVLHTTEGTSWPGYSAGSMTPTFTYDPRSHQMRQHIPVNMAGRALVGSTTNRMNCAQIEVIGFAALGGPLDAQAVQDLGALLAWLNTEWSVPLVAPYAFAAAGYHRMSNAEWTVFRGVCGHQHVPLNDHWDPGAMNAAAILAAAHSSSAAGGVVSGTAHIPGAPTFPGTTTQEDDMKAFIKISGDDRVYISDGATAWQVPDVATLADYATLVHEGLYSIKQPPAGSPGAVNYKGVWVREVNRIALLGKVVS